MAWIGRDWLEELWERLPPTVTVGGWYRPHLRGAAFLFTHAFVLPAEDSPPIMGSCLLQLLFVYTAHTLWRARVDTLHHGRNRPPFPILVNRVRTQVLSILRYVGHKTGGGFPTTAPPAPISRGPGPRIVFLKNLLTYVP